MLEFGQWEYQGRHGEFEPDKVQYSTPKCFDRLFLIRAIETQKFGKDQTVAALKSVVEFSALEYKF